MAERVLSKLLARTHAVMEEWQLDQSPSLDRVSQWQRKRLSDVLQPLVEKHTLTFAQRMVHKNTSSSCALVLGRLSVSWRRFYFYSVSRLRPWA